MSDAYFHTSCRLTGEREKMPVCQKTRAAWVAACGMYRNGLSGFPYHCLLLFFSLSVAAQDADRDGYLDAVDPSPSDPELPGYAKTAIPEFSQFLGSDNGDFPDVADGGDLNGDGIDDLIIGMPFFDDSVNANVGQVLYFDGPTLQVFGGAFGTGFNHLYGYSVSSAGDVDGDGTNEVVAGAPGSPNFFDFIGYINVIDPSNNVLLYTISPPLSPGGWFGYAVSEAGDYDNDGRSDIIVGAPWDGNSDFLSAGSITIYKGIDGTELYKDYGIKTGANLGYSVSDAGDPNGDNQDDTVAGMPNFDNYEDFGEEGRARNYNGSGFFEFVPSQFPGDSSETNKSFGFAVSGAGNNSRFSSQFDAFMVGSPMTDTAAGVNAGSVVVIDGCCGNEIMRFTGDHANSLFGTDLDNAGDVNGDGVEDLVVSATDAQESFTDSGMVRVFSGDDGRILRTFYGSASGDEFGNHVSAAGDINNDGFDDIIVAVNASVTGSPAYIFYGYADSDGDGYGDSEDIAPNDPAVATAQDQEDEPPAGDLADYRVSDIEFLPNLINQVGIDQVGDQIQINVTVTNMGLGNGDEFNIFVNLLDLNSGGEVLEVIDERPARLNAGDQYAYTVVYTVNQSSHEALTFEVEIDPDNTVPESNEDDNSLVHIIAVDFDTFNALVASIPAARVNSTGAAATAQILFGGTDNNGSNIGTQFGADKPVYLAGKIIPPADDIGKSAMIYVALKTTFPDNTLTITRLGTDGNFVNWNLTLPDLDPAFTVESLDQETSFRIASASLPAGDYTYFLAYQLTTGGPLYYSKGFKVTVSE